MATPDEVKFLEEMFDNILKATAGKIEPGTADALVKFHVAHNAARNCIEVFLSKCTPFDVEFLTVLSAEIAGMILSAAPLEDHEHAVMSAATMIPQALHERVQRGRALAGHWGPMGGHTSPNIPTKKTVN